MVQPQQTHRPPQRSVLEAYVSVTGATYTAKAGDRVIGVNRAGAVTVTLPTAQLRKGRVYTVKDESGAAATNNITVATEGSENIDGSATDVIDVNYESKSYYSDGTNWFILPVTPDTNTQLALATTVSTQAHGDAAAGGSASTASKGDHKHGMPSALGLSSTVSTQAHGDSAAAGTATDASKGDHKHAMPAAGSGPSQATQAALEAQTNENTYAPPDLIKHSPGVAKAWCRALAAGALQAGSYNIASITDTGVGDRTIVFNVDFANTEYICAGGEMNANVNDAHLAFSDSLAVGSVQHTIQKDDGTLVDVGTGSVFFGDQ